MNDFLKCECSHCGQPIEYPSDGTGQAVPCPTCGKPITLTPVEQPEAADEARPKTEWQKWIALNERLKERRIKSGIQLSDEFTSAQPGPEIIPPATNPPPVREYREPRPLFADLSEATIRKIKKSGETPLHRAAKMGRINEIPKHLLTAELFMARDNSFTRKTPVHLAAEFGQLNKVPREFLTRETMTASTEYEKKESRTGPAPPRTETPLHVAARCGHADQIPKEFLTPEFLSVEASGYRETVLHSLAHQNRLDLVPAVYADSPMWNLRNSSGQTPREIVETNIKQEAYIARVRMEPATEKQKGKLRWFGFTFDETISKGDASDSIDKCVRDFPEKDRAYYNRPATGEQLEQLKPLLKGSRTKAEDYAEPGKPLTYGRAKDLISERAMENRHDDRVDEMEQLDYYFTIIEFLRWRDDMYPHLTYARVKKAAKALDKSNSGWTKAGDCQNLLLQKVVELNPEWAEKENWLRW